MLSKRAAKGEGCGGANVDLGDKYSRKGDDKLSGKMVWLGRNFRAFDGSDADTGFVRSFTHISVRCVLCLNEYRSKSASEGGWLELGL